MTSPTDLDAGGGTSTGGGGGTSTGGGGGTTSPLATVQCRTNADCPGQSTCTTTAPGGVCNGCGSSADCPGATDCGSFAACVLSCTTDPDCGGARRCTTAGLCAIRTCSPTTACPAPYVCSSATGSGLCQRPACAGGCPAPLTCTGTVCVEP